jgi:hypothetical protein
MFPSMKPLLVIFLEVLFGIRTPLFRWQIVRAIEDMKGDPSKSLYQMNDLFEPKERLEISNNADC